MANLLKDKVATVTGASSGIGRATAVAFAREGAKVVVSDVDVEGGEETVDIIKKNGGEAFFIKADVSDKDEVELFIQKAVEKYGRLDCAFNNAGISGPQSKTADYKESEWDSVIGVNLKGVWLCMKYQIPQMLENKGGSIINCSSILGHVGFENAPAYVTSKHGVNGLTKAASLEYSKEGIRVNAVCPAFIKTPLLDALDDELLNQLKMLHPIGRLGEPEEVAEFVVWLASEKSSFVTGRALAVDGGFLSR